MYVLGSWCVRRIVRGAHDLLALPTFLIAGSAAAWAACGPPTGSSCSGCRHPDKIGEFFRLYGLAGKFQRGHRPGPVRDHRVDAARRRLGKGAYQMGILSFLILMLIGIVLLRSVPDRLSEPAAG